jgi:hypothetical protein
MKVNEQWNGTSKTLQVKEWNQPFHDEMRCGSSACIHEHISFHILSMDRYDSFLVNVFSCEISG